MGSRPFGAGNQSGQRANAVPPRKYGKENKEPLIPNYCIRRNPAEENLCSFMLGSGLTDKRIVRGHFRGHHPEINRRYLEARFFQWPCGHACYLWGTRPEINNALPGNCTLCPQRS